MTTTGIRIVRLALVTACILMVPLLAMQFTDAVAWDPIDFAVAGALLFGAGLAYELVARKARGSDQRLAAGLAIATALALIWVNLAVGIIGSSGNPANLLYLGVLAVGVVGTVVARFRPCGVARALIATALVQALVPAIAFAIWKPTIASVDDIVALARVIALNTCFAALFAGAAWLFRRVDVVDEARDRPLG